MTLQHSRKPSVQAVPHAQPRGDNGGPAPHMAVGAAQPASATKSRSSTAGPGEGMRVRNLYKSYMKGVVHIPVLRGVSLDIRPGEFVAIVGQSGSGKSTLLHLMGTLDAADKGEILFNDVALHTLSQRRRDEMRNRYFGMIFQFYHLVPEMTTLENVLAPLMIRESIWGYWRRRKSHAAAARQLLERVGLGHRLNHKPNELSGGEMQRAAIARALVTAPAVLLADEPTGNLDKKTGGEIMELLTSLNEDERLTIVMVTHDMSVAQRADRMVHLVDGRIASG